MKTYGLNSERHQCNTLNDNQLAMSEKGYLEQSEGNPLKKNLLHYFFMENMLGTDTNSIPLDIIENNSRIPKLSECP